MPPFKPYASKKQERWAHSQSGFAALGFTDVKGKDQASKGKALPERSAKARKGRR
jgi:hypothetical protein